MISSGYGYRCSAGETFDLIALKLYGDEKYACDLLGANPALCGLTALTGGETLIIPVVEVPNDTQENAYTPAIAPWKE